MNNGNVNGFLASGLFSVHIAGDYGYDINAANATGLKLDLGDLVQCEQRSPGLWEIVARITVHPDPVVPDPPATPNVTVPSAPSSPSTPQTISIPSEFAYPTSSTNASLLGYLQAIYTILSTHRTNASRLSNNWSPILSQAASDAYSARSSVRTTAQQLSGVADVADAGSDVLDAVVESGAAVRVQGFSIDAVPAGNIAGFNDWNHESSLQVEYWLNHRVKWFGEIRAALHRARQFRSLSSAPTLPTAPGHDPGDRDWSDAVTRIQATDDWATTCGNLLEPSIATLRTNLSLPAFSYPGGTFAWSNGGTFAASKAALASSLTTYHRYYTAGLGTAVIECIRKINS